MPEKVILPIPVFSHSVRFCAGEVANIIPENAILQGTLRTNNEAAREILVKRIREVSERTAAVYNGSIEYTVLSAVPPLICNPDLTEEFVSAMKTLCQSNTKWLSGY